MSVFATIIVTNANQSAAQAITSSDMFTTLLKKGFSKYWVSSGLFNQEHYDALVGSDLIHASETDSSVRASATISSLGMTLVDPSE